MNSEKKWKKKWTVRKDRRFRMLSAFTFLETRLKISELTLVLFFFLLSFDDLNDWANDMHIVFLFLFWSEFLFMITWCVDSNLKGTVSSSLLNKWLANIEKQRSRITLIWDLYSWKHFHCVSVDCRFMLSQKMSNGTIKLFHYFLFY